VIKVRGKTDRAEGFRSMVDPKSSKAYTKVISKDLAPDNSAFVSPQGVARFGRQAQMKLSLCRPAGAFCRKPNDKQSAGLILVLHKKPSPTV